jgi:hypothetical protein
LWVSGAEEEAADAGDFFHQFLPPTDAAYWKRIKL